MVPALCTASPFFGQVALRVVMENEHEEVIVSILPEQAMALAKALTRAARAAHETQG